MDTNTASFVLLEPVLSSTDWQFSPVPKQFQAASTLEWLIGCLTLQPDASTKFFVQANMITSGRPSYFQKLYYRMLKKLRSEISTGVDIGQVFLHLCLPEEKGKLFYAVLQPPHGRHGINWCLIPAITAKSNASDIIYMDCWSWKSQVDLQTSPGGSTEAIHQKGLQTCSI